MAAKPAGKLPATPKTSKSPAPKAPKAAKGASIPATKAKVPPKTPPPKPKRNRVDWEAVERDYRLGKYSLRELEAKHGANNAAISRKVKSEGWTKDLSEAVNQATNARLMQEMVSKEISANQQSVSTAVLAVAEVNTRVILGHRTGLQRITAVKERLLDQIEQAAAQMPDLAEVIELVRKEDDNGIDRANDALRKAMSRSSLIDDLKKLAEVDEKVRKGEREAFNIPAIGTEPADQAAKPKKRYILDFVDVEPRDE